MTQDQSQTPIKIALADDEPDLRLVFTRLLKLLGHQVVYAAADGAELLDACRDQKVDLAILDLDMPVMDGLQTAERLAELGIPVILVSGHPDVREVVVENEPVVTRILKPATLDSFRNAIAEAMTAKG